MCAHLSSRFRANNSAQASQQHPKLNHHWILGNFRRFLWLFWVNRNSFFYWSPSRDLCQVLSELFLQQSVTGFFYVNQCSTLLARLGSTRYQCFSYQRCFYRIQINWNWKIKHSTQGETICGTCHFACVTWHIEDWIRKGLKSLIFSRRSGFETFFFVHFL